MNKHMEDREFKRNSFGDTSYFDKRKKEYINANHSTSDDVYSRNKTSNKTDIRRYI